MIGRRPHVELTSGGYPACTLKYAEDNCVRLPVILAGSRMYDRRIYISILYESRGDLFGLISIDGVFSLAGKRKCNLGSFGWRTSSFCKFKSRRPCSSS